jgi:rod shape determining protein RodA
VTPFLRKLLGLNWLLIGVMLGLAGFGIVAIYSATYFYEGSYNNFWRQQLMWVALGTVIFLVTSLIDYRWVKWGALPMYICSVMFLLLTLIKGTRVNGAKSWLHLGPINFQPAQLAIIGGILIIALLLSQFRSWHPMLRLALVGAIAGGPMLLILKQPDLGETIVWGPVLLAMLLVAGIPLRYIICITLLVVTAMPIAFYFKLEPYQQARITAFMHPEVDPKGAAWDINNSLSAIGSGGWNGKGFLSPDALVGQGIFKTAGHTDYIFTTISEQWGFIGSVLVLGAFALLLLICLFTAYHASDELGMLISVGLAALLFFHIYQSVGMTIALMPITGVPLPLLSYGGSFAVLVMFGLGLVNSVWVHRKSLA